MKLTDTLRSHGALSFFKSGVPDLLFARASQSASTYLEYLLNADEGKKVLSKSDAFYDAIVSDNIPCAKAIAENSPTSFNPKYEYEEDFLFIHFLMQHFFMSADDEKCQETIEGHLEVSEGGDEELRDIASSFLTNDSKLFNQGLSIYLQKRSDDIEARISREAISEDRWAWERYYSVQGLALIRLADRKGMDVDSGYLHISDSLRRLPSLDHSKLTWRSL